MVLGEKTLFDFFVGKSTRYHLEDKERMAVARQRGIPRRQFEAMAAPGPINWGPMHPAHTMHPPRAPLAPLVCTPLMIPSCHACGGIPILVEGHRRINHVRNCPLVHRLWPHRMRGGRRGGRRRRRRHRRFRDDDYEYDDEFDDDSDDDDDEDIDYDIDPDEDDDDDDDEDDELDPDDEEFRSNYSRRSYHRRRPHPLLRTQDPRPHHPRRVGHHETRPPLRFARGGGHHGFHGERNPFVMGGGMGRYDDGLDDASIVTW